MNKETINKPDGRYIIFYSFDEDEPEGEQETQDLQPQRNEDAE